MSKILCLCSGGFDSVVMLHHIRDLHPDDSISTLFFNYGQKSLEMERRCAKKVSDKLGCTFIEIDIPRFSWSNSEFYSQGFSGDKEYLEMRNLIFFSYALSLCDSLGFTSLYAAILKSQGYYDTSEPFLSKIRGIAQDRGVELLTPFSSYEKYQLSYLAFVYEIKEGDFFSCDNPVDGNPCGECPDCKLIKDMLSGKFSLSIHRFLETWDVSDPVFQRLFIACPVNEIRIHNNNKCQLRCKHCYYGYSDLYGKELTEDEYRNLFKQAKELGISAFHFSGKEPLYDDSVFDLIQVLREEYPESQVSFVTNGINVPKFIDKLVAVEPQKVCLSVDEILNTNGVRSVHNVSEKALAALRNAGIPIEVFIDLHQNNIKKISDIVGLIHKSYGVTKFYVRTIVPIGSAKDMPLLSVTQLNTVYKNLKRFCKKNPDVNIQLRLGIDYVYSVLNHNVEISHALKDIYLGDSIDVPNLFIWGELYCGKYESQITITTDGYVQGCASESCFSDYCAHSVGNIREHSLSELIQLGKQRSLQDLVLNSSKFCCMCSEKY